jgi:hypothetical protein
MTCSPPPNSQHQRGKGQLDTKKPTNLSRFGNHQRLTIESYKSQQICKWSENPVSLKAHYVHTGHQPHTSIARSNTSTSTPHHHTPASQLISAATSTTTPSQIYRHHHHTFHILHLRSVAFTLIRKHHLYQTPTRTRVNQNQICSESVRTLQPQKMQQIRHQHTNSGDTKTGATRNYSNTKHEQLLHLVKKY